MAGLGSRITLNRSYTAEVDGVTGTFNEVVPDNIYIFNDGRIEVRVRPHQLSARGGISFQETDFTPEQLAVRDAFITMLSEKVQARMEVLLSEADSQNTNRRNA